MDTLWLASFSVLYARADRGDHLITHVSYSEEEETLNSPSSSQSPDVRLWRHEIVSLFPLSLHPPSPTKTLIFWELSQAIWVFVAAFMWVYQVLNNSLCLSTLHTCSRPGSVSEYSITQKQHDLQAFKPWKQSDFTQLENPHLDHKDLGGVAPPLFLTLDLAAAVAMAAAGVRVGACLSCSWWNCKVCPLPATPPAFWKASCVCRDWAPWGAGTATPAPCPPPVSWMNCPAGIVVAPPPPALPMVREVSADICWLVSTDTGKEAVTMHGFSPSISSLCDNTASC